MIIPILGDKEDLNFININKEKILYIIFVTSFIAGSSAYIRYLPMVQICLMIIYGISLVWYGYKSIKDKIDIKLDIIIICLYVALSVSTYKGNHNPAIIYMILQAVGVTIFMNYEIQKDIELFLHLLLHIVLSFLIINLLLILIMPSGFNGSGNTAFYLLGYRIAFTPFAILAVLISLILDIIDNIPIISIRTVLTIIIAVSNVAIKNVGTGIVSLLILIVGYYTLKYINKKLVNMWFVFGAYVIGVIAIIIYQIQFRWRFLSYILVDILNKDITFDNRTYIWNSTILNIIKKPILGYGIDSNAEVIFPYSVRSLPAHNQFLCILEDGGMVSFIIFSVLLIYLVYRVQEINDNRVRSLLIFMYLALLIIFVTEIQTTKSIVFIIFGILYHGIIIEKEVINEEVCVNNNS